MKKRKNRMNNLERRINKRGKRRRKRKRMIILKSGIIILKNEKFNEEREEIREINGSIFPLLNPNRRNKVTFLSFPSRSRPLSFILFFFCMKVEILQKNGAGVTS